MCVQHRAHLPAGRWSIFKRQHCWLPDFCQPSSYEEFKFWFKCPHSIITEYTKGSILTWAKESIISLAHTPSMSKQPRPRAHKSVSWKHFTTGILQWGFVQFRNHLFFFFRPCFRPCVRPWGFSNDETQPLLQEAHSLVNYACKARYNILSDFT